MGETRGSGGVLRRVLDTIAAVRGRADVELAGEARLVGQRLSVPLSALPLEVVLAPGSSAPKTLHVCLDQPLRSGTAPLPQRLLVFDPEQAYSRISAPRSLEPGQGLVLGRSDPEQDAALGYPETVAGRHLRMAWRGDRLLLRDLGPGTRVSRLDGTEQRLRRRQWRLAKLERLREVFGGPLRPLPHREALESLRRVNRIMEHEAYRPADAEGRPGAVLRLPDELTPILVGDLHGQVDNLVEVFSENAFLEALEAGGAALIILGDAVHSEVEGEMEQMESSMLMMDLIFRLKLRFPRGVFYVRGNHDAFLPSISKGGIAQGPLWELRLEEARGRVYVEEMETYYRRLPYVALTGDFIACHAAPPTMKVTLDRLVNATRDTRLLEQITCNRVRRPNYLAGYGSGEVRRLRKALGLAPALPFIVAHNPLADGRTLWLNVEGIENHHIVYSANTDRLALFTRIGGRMVPLWYPAERLLPIINGPPEAAAP